MARLHTERLGTPGGARLLAVHGVRGHALRWRDFAGRLAGRDVLAVDLRGHGHSLAEPPWSLEQHAADLADTLDAHGWEGPLDVVGHSFGGAVATVFLALHPRRVRRIVLLDPVLHHDPQACLADAQATIASDGFASPDEAAASRRAGLDESGHWALPGEVADHLVAGGDGRYRWRFSPPAVVAAWGEMARATPPLRLRRPTLVVVADRGQLTNDAYLAALHAELGGALRVEHVDSGHMLYWERPAQTAAMVDSFLGADH